MILYLTNRILIFSYCVFLFNELLFIQLVLFILLFFVALASDYIFILLNSALFLFISGMLLWLVELDVYVNFLMIIDLGVFFVLTALLINFISLFQAYNSSGTSIIFFSICLSFIFFFKWSPSLCLPDTTYIVFYNWFSIFSLNYFTDLQLLSDIYYLFNSFEFIFMNLYLYLAIFIVYLFFNLKQAVELKFNLHSLNYTNHGETTVLMKQQDFHKQSQQLSTVRAWGRLELKQTPTKLI